MPENAGESSVSMPSVLVVYPGSVLAPSGGAERTRVMCRALKASGMTLHLVSHDCSEAAIDALGIFSEISSFRPEAGIRLKGKEKSFLSRNIDIEFDAFARSMVIETKPAAVIAVFAWTAGVLTGLPKNILGILDTIDIQHVRTSEAERCGVANFDRYASKTEELRMLRKADLLVAIQCNETRALKDLLPSKKVICAGHSMAPKPLGSPEDSKSVLFVGSNYALNTVGVAKFIESGWPAIVRRYPNATFDICGGVCKGLVRFSGNPGVRLHGLVDDLTPFYTQAAVVVNVALCGTGLPIKTVEAISYGKCLVCTPLNARGFDLSAFPGAICEFDALADRIGHWLGDHNERRHMESAAASFSKKEMQPGKVYGELIAEIRTHAGQRLPCEATPQATPGLFFDLLNYPLRSLFRFHAGRALSRVLYMVSTQRRIDSELLSSYLKLRWRLLRLDNGIAKTAMFGAGQHTAWIEWVLGKTVGPDIAAVVDDNPDGRGTFFGLKPMKADRFDPKTVDAIILSSDCLQEQMKQRCRKLYGEEVKLIDLYEGLPPGPYEKE